MMVQALLLLPRLVVTRPPARLVVVPPQSAAVRRFNAPGVQLGEDGGRPARGAEQLLAAVGNAQARGGSVQMCSATRDSDREKLLAAVQQNGRALYYASAELKADREVVLAAVQQDGHALRYASAELRADRKVVLAAVQQDWYAFRFASAELWADREFMLAAVQQDGDALYYASAELKADREVVLAAVQQGGYALCYASAELQADREVVLAAVRQDGGAVEYASAELQRDDAVLKASYHIFTDLDRLADRGQLKVLRTLASVRECGRQMNNCLAYYDLAQCDRHILVKLDGDDGIPRAVGSFANGAWQEIRYTNNFLPALLALLLPRAASANQEDVLGQFDSFLPALQAFQLEPGADSAV
jgi:hypothetical protein